MNESLQNPSAPHEDRREKAIGLALCLIGLFLAFWTAFFPVRFCNDPWWHLKTGKYLIEYMGEHGFAFPPTDVFSLTGSQTPWVNHEWLSDMLLYAMYLVGGLPFCVFVKALTVAATGFVIILMLRADGCRWGWCGVGAMFAILVAQTTLYLRPPILTYFFIVLFVYLLQHFFLRYPIRITAALVGLEVLWINLHGGGVLGVILCGFFLAERFWNWFAQEAGIGGEEDHAVGKAWLCFILVGLASLANPWAYEVYLLPGKVLGDQWLVSRLGELESPNLRMAVALRLLLAGFLLIPFLRGPRIGLFRGITLLMFGYQAMSYLRQVPLLGLVGVPVLVERLDESSQWLADNLRQGKQDLVRTLGTFLRKADAAIVMLVLGYYAGWNPPWVAGMWVRNLEDLPILLETGYRRDSFPEGAVNFLLYHKIPGPMMNNDNFAGYLIWRLSPETMQVFTDSRFDLFGSKYAKEERAVIEARDEPEGFYDEDIWITVVKPKWDFWKSLAATGRDPDITAWVQSGKKYWQWILEDKYRINFILVYCKEDPIDVYLQSGDHGWKPIYNRRDEGYEIYLADRPENQALLERIQKKHEVGP